MLELWPRRYQQSVEEKTVLVGLNILLYTLPGQWTMTRDTTLKLWSKIEWQYTSTFENLILGHLRASVMA